MTEADPLAEGGPRDGQPAWPVEDPLLAAIQDLASGQPSEGSCVRIFHAYHRRVRGYLFQRLGSRTDAEDLTQKTFLRVFTHRPSFTSRSEFEGWLFLIARNLSRNERRDRQSGIRKGELSLDLLAEVDLARLAAGESASSDGPLDKALARERSARVVQALGRLPDQQRRCVALRYYQGLKYREVASIMGLATDTVKAHLYQARGRLKELLQDEIDLEELDDREPSEEDS